MFKVYILHKAEPVMNANAFADHIKREGKGAKSKIRNYTRPYKKKHRGNILYMEEQNAH